MTTSFDKVVMFMALSFFSSLILVITMIHILSYIIGMFHNAKVTSTMDILYIDPVIWLVRVIKQAKGLMGVH